jgi:hypothetical protein
MRAADENQFNRRFNCRGEWVTPFGNRIPPRSHTADSPCRHRQARTARWAAVRTKFTGNHAAILRALRCDGTARRVSAKIQSRGYGDHTQEICAWRASCFGALRQFQSRIQVTTYQQAWHYHFWRA